MYNALSYVITYDDLDIDTIREIKLDEISKNCATAILGGVDVETSVGVEHFSLEMNDQINISNNALQAQLGNPTLYHADGQECRVFLAQEMLVVAETAVIHKTYHTTYHNHLKQWIKREEDREILCSIIYGIELPDDLADNMTALFGYGGDIA